MEGGKTHRFFETTGKTRNNLPEIKLDRPLFTGGSLEKGHNPYIVIADIYQTRDNVDVFLSRKIIYSSKTFERTVFFNVEPIQNYNETLRINSDNIVRTFEADDSNEIRFHVNDNTVTCRNLEFAHLEIIHVKFWIPSFGAIGNYFTIYSYLLKYNLKQPYYLIDWQYVRGPNGIGVSYDEVEGLLFVECSVCLEARAIYECVSCKLTFCENKKCHKC